MTGATHEKRATKVSPGGQRSVQEVDVSQHVLLSEWVSLQLSEEVHELRGILQPRLQDLVRLAHTHTHTQTVESTQGGLSLAHTHTYQRHKSLITHSLYTSCL